MLNQMWGRKHVKSQRLLQNFRPGQLGLPLTEMQSLAEGQVMEGKEWTENETDHGHKSQRSLLDSQESDGIPKSETSNVPHLTVETFQTQATGQATRTFAGVSSNRTGRRWAHISMMNFHFLK